MEQTREKSTPRQQQRFTFVYKHCGKALRKKALIMMLSESGLSYWRVEAETDTKETRPGTFDTIKFARCAIYLI